MTACTKLASVSTSALMDRSPSVTARRNRARSSLNPATRCAANSFRNGSSPQESAPCTHIQVVGVCGSVNRSTAPWNNRCKRIRGQLADDGPLGSSTETFKLTYNRLIRMAPGNDVRSSSRFWVRPIHGDQSCGLLLIMAHSLCLSLVPLGPSHIRYVSVSIYRCEFMRHVFESRYRTVVHCQRSI